MNIGLKSEQFYYVINMYCIWALHLKECLLMHLKGVLTNETALLVEPLQEDLIKSAAVPGGEDFTWSQIYVVSPLPMYSN